MKIFFIILHFGDIRTTQECIASIYAHETHPFSLIVVNNAKEKYIAKDFSNKKITVINNKKNLGFAGGVNVGIQLALQKKADAVCLLNNDTIFTKPILLELCKQLKGSVGIVGPAIAFNKTHKRLYDMGGKVKSLFLRTSHIEVESIEDKKAKHVTYISGCCMLVKKEVFNKIGLFDESFFLYYEDADFCLRAQEKGFEVVVTSAVTIQHKLSHSAGKMSDLAIYHLLRSGIFFGRKYAKNSMQRIANRTFILIQALLFLKANRHAASVIGKALLE